RRRHTRCLSDWSSDVCSSDLVPAEHDRRLAGLEPGSVLHAPVPGVGRQLDAHLLAVGTGDREGVVRDAILFPAVVGGVLEAVLRSEERRVGKEWRSGWGEYV